MDGDVYLKDMSGNPLGVATNPLHVYYDAQIGATTLNGLSDVIITLPIDGEVLTYDATGIWKNGTGVSSSNYATNSGWATYAEFATYSDFAGYATDSGFATYAITCGYATSCGSATNADTLDGSHASSFASIGHDHDTTYLGITDKATDSELLDGVNSTGYATSNHTHKIDNLSTDITGILKGNGATVEAATENTDYAAAAHASRHQSGGADTIKLDDLTAPDDTTDLDASTSRHGLLPKATAPASGLVNVVGIGNGESVYSNKALFDTTNPAVPGSVSPGTSIIAARRDHVHSLPLIKNILVNGDFSVWQQGEGPFTAVTTPANNDGTYLADMWILLSDGNDVVDVRKEPGGEDLAWFTIQTANKKFGVVQLIDAKTTASWWGVPLVLSARCSGDGSLDGTKVKGAIIIWSGAADAMTRDVVSSWGATGTNPTLSAGWGYAGSPVTTNVLSNSDISMKLDVCDGNWNDNMAVFIWIDSAAGTVGDSFTIADAQLVQGTELLPFMANRYSEELVNCKFHFERIKPGVAAIPVTAGGFIENTTDAYGLVFYQTKRVTPTISVNSTTDWVVRAAGALAYTATDTAFLTVGKSTCNMAVTSTGMTAGLPMYVRTRSVNSYIDIDARL